MNLMVTKIKGGINMKLVNVKNNIKSFWEENKTEIIETGICVVIGIAVGKVICWKLDSKELKKLKKLTGDAYPNLGFLANDLGKSKSDKESIPL